MHPDEGFKCRKFDEGLRHELKEVVACILELENFNFYWINTKPLRGPQRERPSIISNFQKLTQI